MKVLVIDNITKSLDKIVHLLGSFDIDVIRYDQLQNFQTDLYDLIILTGGFGEHLPVIFNTDQNINEIELIKSSKVPILGICYGCQLIASAYGGQIIELDEKREGLVNLELVTPDPIFENIQNFQVFEAHKYAISKIPEEFKGLARSTDGFEVIKHNEKPIYGFQFHPELHKGEAYGDEIFKNFLKTYFKI